MHSQGTSRVHVSSGRNVSHLTHIYCGHPTECPFNPSWNLTDFTVLTWRLGLAWSGLEHGELDLSGLEMVQVSLYVSCMHLLPKTGPFRYQYTEQQLISNTLKHICTGMEANGQAVTWTGWKNITRVEFKVLSGSTLSHFNKLTVIYLLHGWLETRKNQIRTPNSLMWNSTDWWICVSPSLASVAHTWMLINGSLLYLHVSLIVYSMITYIFPLNYLKNTDFFFWPGIFKAELQ